MLEQSKGFSNFTILCEFMYLYITFQLDIGYAVTNLSKFSSALTAFHSKLLKGVAKYLWSAINWDIWFRCSKTLSHPDFSLAEWYDLNNNILAPFDVNITQPFLVGFIDVARTNNLCKWLSTTWFVHIFCCGSIVYKSKIK